MLNQQVSGLFCQWVLGTQFHIDYLLAVTSRRRQVEIMVVFVPGDPCYNPGRVKIFSALYFRMSGLLIPHEEKW